MLELKPGRAERETSAVGIDAVSHGFGELEVLADLSLDVAQGEVVGLVGPSGCGKSTLLELISGLAEPRSGRIEAAGSASPRERLAHCAYMPQRDLLFPWLSALDNASLAHRNRGASKREARESALPLFERFGLGDFAAARPGELSGGMRQRVAFLRTLLAGKPVLLLDEPFAALDAITRAEMQEWLAGALTAEPRTVLLVTHDVEEALYLCDRVAVLTSRPARVAAELSVGPARSPDRSGAVTAPGFSKAREEALRLLREHSR
jgi:ABC-type nitrate/sulfonate/bicarbonate transport system ATPase subunit